jgi:hypothetical protein
LGLKPIPVYPPDQKPSVYTSGVACNGRGILLGMLEDLRKAAAAKPDLR